MEEELKCPVCKQFYCNPILMPCYHTLCLNCALNIQQPVNLNHNTPNNNHNNNNNVTSPTNTPNSSTYIVTATVHQNADEMVHTSSISGDISATSSTAGSEISDADKVSLLSETDSGVICNSRPNSYVGTPNIQGILFPPLQSLNAISLSCPVCHKLIYLDESGAHNLPKNRTMQTIVDKFGDSRNLSTDCQLCETDPKEAVIMCEQCEIYYCDTCRESCHPQRGPLASHKLIAAHLTKNYLRLKSRSKDSAPKCGEHPENPLSSFCMLCKIPICNTCAQENRHSNHDIQALGMMCKAQKTELSQTLQTLSEKAKNATEFIQRLKGITEKANENSSNFETEIASQCDTLIATIQARKQQLLAFARKEKDYKLRILRDQVSACTTKLQHTTGLIQFCIEALKETDPTAYLQIGSALISRVSNVEMTWNKDMNTSPWISPEFDLTLDCQPVLMAVEQLTFSQMKPPGPPILIPDECISENNGITIAWQPHPSSFVEGFVLELDDGNSGAFREVYCGKETICTVDGLHFNSLYRVRVKAYNSTGEGAYSDIISLQTADVAWFTLDPLSGHPDILISNENQTVTCDSYEHRVVLGNIGFSRGVHYWEINIDRYQNNADIAFGIARSDVSKDKMLGKDECGWSMYIDNKRSWFLHSDHHDQRAEGGVEVGNVVGVLLNLETHQLSFYVNDEQQGPIAFTDLKGVFYPALSLNRNVTITVTTGIEPPNSSGVNSSIDSEASDGETKTIK